MSEAPAEPGALPMTGTHRDSPGPRAVLWGLAGFEGRRLLRHPATWCGFALALAGHHTSLWFLPVLPRDATTLGTHALPLAVGVLFATYLAASRARRHGATELFDVAPTSSAARVLGATGTVAWALAVGLLWTAAAVGLMYARGGVGSPPPADVAQPVLLVGLGAAIGVALGVWLRRSVYLLPALAVLFGIQNTLSAYHGPVHTLAFALEGSRWLPPAYLFRPVGWHLVYLAGLIGAVAAVAVMRHGVSRARLVAAATAFALVGSGGAAKLAAQPTTSEIQELLAVANSDAMLRCVQRGTVETCTLAGYEGLGAVWSRALTTVIAAAPGAAAPLGRVRVEQHTNAWEVAGAVLFRWFPSEEAQAILDASPVLQQPLFEPVPRPGTLEIDTLFTPDQGLALAAFAGRRLAGIPDVYVAGHTLTEADVAALREFWPGRPLPEAGSTVRFPQPCWLAGQAREVLAIWLAAASSPRHEEALRDLVARDPLYPLWHLVQYGVGEGVGVSFSQGQIGIGHHHIIWSKVGTNLAVQLLDAPGAHERLVDEWARWTAPSATTDELVVAFGLRPIPTLQQFAAEHGVDIDQQHMAELPPLDPFQPEAPTLGLTPPGAEPAPPPPLLPPPLLRDFSSCGGVPRA